MNSRWWIYAVLALIVLSGAQLRLGGITQVGIRFDDEGAYAGDARLWHRCARVVTDSQAIGAILHRDKPSLQRRMDEIGVDFTARYAKPSQGFTLLGAATMFLVGDRPEALLVLNAITGTFSIVLLFALGMTLFGPTIGICAALFLAVSPYHIFYSRCALTEATTGFFVLAGLYVWIAADARNGPRWRRNMFSGILLGMAATCHYRSLFIPFVLMLFELTRRLPDSSSDMRIGLFRRRVCSCGWLALGLIVPALTIECMLLFVRGAGWLSNSYLPLATYFEATWSWAALVLGTGRTDMARDSATAVDHVLTYGGYFLRWNGLILSLLSVIGCLLILWHRGIKRVPAVLVLVLVVLLANQPYAVARALCVILPLLYLGGAVAIVSAVDVLRVPHVWRVALTVMALAICLLQTPEKLNHVRELRSGVADASSFVADHGPATAAIGIDTYHRSKYWLYLERSPTDILNERFHKQGGPELVTARLRNEGVRWVIVDPQRWHFLKTPSSPPSKVFEWWEAMQTHLDSEATLAAEFSHVSNGRWEFLAEGPGLMHLDDMKRKRAGTIRVYDLKPSISLTAGS